MSPASDADLLVLLGVRLRSFGSAQAIAELVGLDPADVTPLLERFADKEWVRYREGAIEGWMLSPAGREEGERLLADELDVTGTRSTVDGLYRRFLDCNRSLLQVCTDWQLRTVDNIEVVNDHTDHTYDAGVIAALRNIDASAQVICTELTSSLDRFASYGPRFTNALAHVDAGERDWFDKPLIDSYHSVWFELHENLLATLGIERGKDET